MNKLYSFSKMLLKKMLCANFNIFFLFSLQHSWIRIILSQKYFFKKENASCNFQFSKLNSYGFINKAYSFLKRKKTKKSANLNLFFIYIYIKIWNYLFLHEQGLFTVLVFFKRMHLQKREYGAFSVFFMWTNND